MARSWLANAKTVYDLKNDISLMNIKTDADWQEQGRREALKLGRLKERDPRHLPVPPEIQHYFLGGLHDSAVLGVDRQPDRLILRLSHCKAATITNLFRQVQTDNEIFPVDIILHDVVYARATRYDQKGNLRFFPFHEIGKSTHNPGWDLLHDWFEVEDGRLQWIANLWSNTRPGTHSPNVFLMVDCHSVTVEDHVRASLVSQFGPLGAEVWDLASTVSPWDNYWEEAERMLLKNGVMPKR